ncbi:MAG: hypothetical protein JWR69_2147 [Pedosphaera sp.]|nr:hypothetical protein [Pedosphaera sp.]
MLLGGTELALRLAGYGYSPHFFQKLRIGDEERYINNDQFGLSFFPPELTRFPSPLNIPAGKPADTYRIFILGESAAMGDPEPAFGAGRYLQTLLQEKFPTKKFEVVNVGVTAINSHVILPIARECARYDGDLWIIYMGNNEMVGPFGAATTFGPQAPPVGFVRFSLALQQTRLGQLMAAMGRKLKGKSSKASSWGGMQMFVQNQVKPGDPRKEAVYRNFQQNLQDILKAGVDSGAKVILSTVGVNLKDSPPFASLAGTDLPAADRPAYERHYTEGCRAEAQGDFTTAAREFEQASRLDAQPAELEFRWGESVLRLGQASAARAHFQRACDLDALPFRADSRINDLITQAARQPGNRGVVWFDAVSALETNNPTGITGVESFYEHVHFNFDGNYRLARAWAGQVEALLPATITNRAGAEWAGQEVCERRLGLTDWNRRNVLESVMRRMHEAPLSDQSNNGMRLETLRNQANGLRQRMDAPAAAQAREVYVNALKASPDDYFLHENFAEFLVATGDLKQATAEWQRVHELIPHDYLAYFRVGGLLALQGKLSEARASLLQAVAIHPGLSDAWLELGEVRAASGELEPALQDYERARRLRPRDASVPYFMGKALSQLKRSPEAIESFREAIRLRPDYWEAHFALGGESGLHDNVPEAKRDFQEVIRLKPDHAMAHLNLGVAQMKQGELEEAQRQFEETLRLQPENKIALDYLGQVRALKQHKP